VFGFAAVLIGSLWVGGRAIALKPGPSNDSFAVGDGTLTEV
jgi:hypothetical protein